jgi:prophage antirepressor-like protein
MQMFDNGEFTLEVTTSGDSFTVAGTSLAKALGFRDAVRMVESLPDSEKHYTTACTAGGNRRTWQVTEAGFYRAIGQRQAARIRDKDLAQGVVRFQDWVYGTVLPAIRRTGGYNSERADYGAVQPRNSMEKFFEPNTYTWEEVAALIHQRTGIPLTVNELTRMLRTGGVLKQTGAPTVKYRHLFWFTGSSWNVHPHVMPELTFKVFDTGRELQDFRFIQARLEIEGVGQSVTLPAQRQPGMSRSVNVR